MRSVLARLSREPVLIGAAVLQAVDVAVPDALLEEPTAANVRLALAKVLLATVVALFVRAYSSPKAAVSEAKEAGRNEMAADIASLASVLPAPPMPEPLSIPATRPGPTVVDTPPL